MPRTTRKPPPATLVREGDLLHAPFAKVRPCVAHPLFRRGLVGEGSGRPQFDPGLIEVMPDEHVGAECYRIRRESLRSARIFPPVWQVGQ